MPRDNLITITYPSADLTQADVCDLAKRFDRAQSALHVELDLSFAEHTETAALAALILLRRRLLMDGGELCLTGLHDQVAGLYDVNHLSCVLPRHD